MAAPLGVDVDGGNAAVKPVHVSATDVAVP
jgi:hypothetical protein